MDNNRDGLLYEPDDRRMDIRDKIHELTIERVSAGSIRTSTPKATPYGLAFCLITAALFVWGIWLL